MRRLIPLLVVVAQSAVVAHADYRHGRVRLAEGGVALQRASEMETEDAVPNLPFLPGDRVWTDDAGRAEFQFADGTFLRVDRRTKLDYSAYEDAGDREGRVVLRLWSGTLSLHVTDRAPTYVVALPQGSFEARRGGTYRVDLESGEVRLWVYEGEAWFDGERRIRIRTGERLDWRWDDASGRPERFDRYEADAFARWDSEQENGDSWSGAQPDDLPQDVGPYAADLGPYGSWSYEAEFGNVWRPNVGPGWRPYWNGRWVWTVYGWTWLPNEPWGWAPFHYGRWGFSAHLGWYWMPGNTWGPAWVSWALGPDSVGWCALDRRNRPVLIFERSYRGQAVPRSAASGTSAWTFVRQRDLASRDLARRRLEPTASLLGTTRILESAHATLTRDLRVADAERAVPRTVRTRPSPGDTVPELRTDPATTIPHAVPRRRVDGQGRERRAEDGSSATRPVERRRQVEGRDSDADPRTTPPRAVPRPRLEGGEPGERPRHTDPLYRTPHAAPRQRPETERVGEDPPAPTRGRERWRAPDSGTRESDPGRDRRPQGGAARRERTEPERPTPDPQREVLRPLFDPLSQGRQREGEGYGARPRSGGPPPQAGNPSHQGGNPPPQASRPPSQAGNPPPSGGEHANRRGKDKNN